MHKNAQSCKKLQKLQKMHKIAQNEKLIVNLNSGGKYVKIPITLSNCMILGTFRLSERINPRFPPQF